MFYKITFWKCELWLVKSRISITEMSDDQPLVGERMSDDQPLVGGGMSDDQPLVGGGMSDDQPLVGGMSDDQPLERRMSTTSR